MTWTITTEERVSFSEMFEELEKSGFQELEEAKIEIAEQISVVMKIQKITKAELARRLNKTRGYVSQILQGGTNFTVESLINITNALNCSIEIKISIKPAKISWRDHLYSDTESNHEDSLEGQFDLLAA